MKAAKKRPSADDNSSSADIVSALEKLAITDRSHILLPSENVEELEKLEKEPSVFWLQTSVSTRRNKNENGASIAISKYLEVESHAIVTRAFASTVIYLLGEEFKKEYDLNRLTGKALDKLECMINVGLQYECSLEDLQQLYKWGRLWNALNEEFGPGIFFRLPRFSWKMYVALLTCCAAFPLANISGGLYYCMDLGLILQRNVFGKLALGG